LRERGKVIFQEGERRGKWNVVINILSPLQKGEVVDKTTDNSGTSLNGACEPK